MKDKLQIEMNRLHVTEGLIIAINNAKIFNEILKDKTTAIKNLMDKLNLSKLQAQALTDLRLSPDQIEIEPIIKERNRLMDNIARFKKENP